MEIAAIIPGLVERFRAILEEPNRINVDLMGVEDEEARRLFNRLTSVLPAALDYAERRRYENTGREHLLEPLEEVVDEIDDMLDEWNLALIKLQIGQSEADVAPKEVSSSTPYPLLHKIRFLRVRLDDALRYALGDALDRPSGIQGFPLSLASDEEDIDLRSSFSLASDEEDIDLRSSFSLASDEEDIDLRRSFSLASDEEDIDLNGSFSSALVEEFFFCCLPSPAPDVDSFLPNIALEEIHGRDVDRDILVGKVITGNGTSHIQIISINGVGGIGKTALARLVYNDNQIKDCYPLRIWICISEFKGDNFDDFFGSRWIAIVKEIIESVQGSCPNTGQWQKLLEHLRDSILGKKYFLVLDDVWTQDCTEWESLKPCLDCGGEGSTILITTRSERVAKQMGTREMYHLAPLSNKDCWLILSGIALSGRTGGEVQKFKYIGMKIVDKCNGMPLAAKTLGNLLCSKNTVKEWEIVMSSEMWELEEVVRILFASLLLSYNELSSPLRCCFSYCAVFSRNSDIYANKLIQCWSVLGYLGIDRKANDMELRGHKYLSDLVMDSFFSNFVKDESEHVLVCKMDAVVYDFAQFLRKKTSDKIVQRGCQTCSPSLISQVKRYRSLFCQKEPLPYICDCLKRLKVLGLRECGLESIPKEMKKLIYLKYLDLSQNYRLCGEDLKIVLKLYMLETLCLSFCGLQEIPKEIGNLIQLRHLDLSYNSLLKELPDSICNLNELRSLDIVECDLLSALPEGIHRLENLTHLHNLYTCHSCPEGFGQLNGLCTLNVFSSKLSLLKNLNRLSGCLQIRILELSGLEDVVEARQAKLNKKVQIQDLEILFPEDVAEDIDESISMGVMDALEPHPNLRYLEIQRCEGSKLPEWIASPFNQVRQIELQYFGRLLTLPPLGRLPCLEELTMHEMNGLKYVGREFLGITTEGTETGVMDIASSSAWVAAATNTVFFPKLKVLIFYECPNWEKWEDITAEEEDSAAVCLMPCLKKLDVISCEGLAVLPHRLLHKASSLEELDINGSSQLTELYKDKEGSAWKSMSHIPEVRFD